MALSVNIVPRDITEIAKRYAEAMTAALQSKCDKYEKALNDILKQNQNIKTNDTQILINIVTIAGKALSGEGKEVEKQWWEGKTVDELPKYVQVISKEIANDTGVYCKVFKWSIFNQNTFPNNGDWGAEIEGYEPIYLCRAELNFPGQVYGRLHASHLLPATREDYTAYINQQH